MEIKITHLITVSPELLAILTGFGKTQVATIETVAPATTTKPAPAKTAPVKTEATLPTANEMAPAETIQAPTLEEVRAVVQTKAKGGKREEIKALLTSFDADNVTNLAKDKYADFLTKVNNL